MLSPFVAVLMAASLDFAGALVSTKVAKMVGGGLVYAQVITPITVLAALIAVGSVPASEVVFQFQWISEVDKTYAIAGTTNLAGPWINMATNLPATPPTNTFLLIRPLKEFEVFRVIEEPE